MPFEVNLSQHLTPAAIARTVSQLPKLETFMVNLMFSQTRNHTSPMIGLAEIAKAVGNKPVVQRGGMSVPLTAGSRDIEYLVPHGVDLKSFLTAVDLNNLKVMGAGGMKSWVSNEVDTHRRAVRSTVEAMACQAASGQISYYMATDTGNLEPYTVNFGAIQSYTPHALWSLADTSFEEILGDLIGMEGEIQQKSGFGSRIEFIAGNDVYRYLAGKVLITDTNTKIKAEITNDGIRVADFVIRRSRGGYTNLINESWVPAVANNTIKAVAMDAPHTLYYLAIDDVDAGLLPTPLHVRQVKSDEPSGYKILVK
ncbi:MAG: major capsid protein, partial [Magnetococcales bacterium]|nr:major capsid protein [Magnetococcales bacterium]